MKLAVDVAVIGGGLVGTSAALELRRRGLSVALVDKGYCGAQASGVNYGGVRRQGRPLAQLPLSQRSHAVWRNLKSLIGTDGEFLCSGHLKLARNEAEMTSLALYAEEVSGQGLELELLGGSKLHGRFPWIQGNVVGASFCPADGHANPRLVAAGFAVAAAHAGAWILENSPVRDVVCCGGRFELTAGDDIAISARTVINSAGAWADHFAAAFGETVPLRRIYPAMIVTEPVAPLVSVNIGVEGGGIYLRQVERGNCIVGGEKGVALDNPDFSRPDGVGVLAIMERAADLIPALRHAQAIRFWSGTEGAFPDRNPVIGESGTTPGLFHAFGFSGAGFQIAPGVGQVLAELIQTGKSATSLEAFSITRFSM